MIIEKIIKIDKINQNLENLKNGILTEKQQTTKNTITANFYKNFNENEFLTKINNIITENKKSC